MTKPSLVEVSQLSFPTVLGFAVALLVWSQPVAAQSEPALTAALDSVRTEIGFPGVQIAVVRAGEIVYAAELGVSDLASEEPIRPSTRFAIGSMTKPVTATVVMSLVDAGVLTLDDRASQWLPHLPDSYRDVRLRHLLTHTSGLPRDVKQGHSLIGQPLAEALAHLPPEFPAGSRWAYSNTGFIVLGEIVEVATGQSLAAVMKDRVFAPLGMDDTLFLLPDLAVARARGYEGSRGSPSGLSFLPARFGAGSILSTARDLAKWGAGLHDGRVLDLGTQKTMWDPRTVGGPRPEIGLFNGLETTLGYGWFVATDDYDRRLVSHGGSLDGFVGTIDRYVDAEVTFIILANYEPGNVRAFLPILNAHFLVGSSVRSDELLLQSDRVF